MFELSSLWFVGIKDQIFSLVSVSAFFLSDAKIGEFEGSEERHIIQAARGQVKSFHNDDGWSRDICWCRITVFYQVPSHTDCLPGHYLYND